MVDGFEFVLILLFFASLFASFNEWTGLDGKRDNKSALKFLLIAVGIIFVYNAWNSWLFDFIDYIIP